MLVVFLVGCGRSGHRCQCDCDCCCCCCRRFSLACPSACVRLFVCPSVCSISNHFTHNLACAFVRPSVCVCVCVCRIEYMLLGSIVSSFVRLQHFSLSRSLDSSFLRTAANRPVARSLACLFARLLTHLGRLAEMHRRQQQREQKQRQQQPAASSKKEPKLKKREMLINTIMHKRKHKDARPRWQSEKIIQTNKSQFELLY